MKQLIYNAVTLYSQTLDHWREQIQILFGNYLVQALLLRCFKIIYYGIFDLSWAEFLMFILWLTDR